MATVGSGTLSPYVVVAVVLAVWQDREPIQLSASCPPGFRLTDDNRCECITLYDQYDSLQGAGVGGLKTGLPKRRDGFTPQQIDLGRYLFFDPVLSADHSMSCASCHNPQLGFSDGLPTSRGIRDSKLTRAAPSLWNVAFFQSFFWDARADSLEEQAKGPLYAPEEMGNTPENLLNTLNAIPEYRRLFLEAFPNSAREKIDEQDVYAALAAFQSSLISLNSRYDQYAHGYHLALAPNEIEGLNIFRSFVARCAECHTPPLFTNQQVAILGVPEPDGLPIDPGAQETFDDPTLRGGFKVPSLRNIARTAPYMHSGSFKTLKEVAEFYNKGRGHAVPEDENLRLHWHIWEPNLQPEELDRLVDFMMTLTDEKFKPEVPVRLPSGL